MIVSQWNDDVVVLGQVARPLANKRTIADERNAHHEHIIRVSFVFFMLHQSVDGVQRLVGRIDINHLLVAKMIHCLLWMQLEGFIGLARHEELERLGRRGEDRAGEGEEIRLVLGDLWVSFRYLRLDEVDGLVGDAESYQWNMESIELSVLRPQPNRRSREPTAQSLH